MRNLVVAAFVAFSTPCFAAKVELPVDIADGVTWTIETNRTRKTERNGKPTEIVTTGRYRAKYEAAKAGGVLTLTPVGSTAFGDLPANVKLDGFDFPIAYDVDEALAPTRMRNWKELQRALNRFFNGLNDPKAAAIARSIFVDLSDEAAPSIMSPYLSYLGLAQGLALEPGQPLPYDSMLPNPLGGAPIKAKAQFVLESFDPATKRAIVVWTQTPDPESMAASMRISVRNLLAKAGPIPDEGKLEDMISQMRVGRDDRCRFEIDAVTGLALRTECSSVTDIKADIEASRRSDTWVITQTLPEPR